MRTRVSPSMGKPSQSSEVFQRLYALILHIGTGPWAMMHPGDEVQLWKTIHSGKDNTDVAEAFRCRTVSALLVDPPEGAAVRHRRCWRIGPLHPRCMRDLLVVSAEPVQHQLSDPGKLHWCRLDAAEVTVSQYSSAKRRCSLCPMWRICAHEYRQKKSSPCTTGDTTGGVS